MTIYLLTSEPSKKNDQIEKIEAKLLNVIPELRKIEKIEDIAADIRGKPDTKIVVIYLSPTLAGSGHGQLYQCRKPLPRQSFLYFGQQRDLRRRLQTLGALGRG